MTTNFEHCEWCGADSLTDLCPVCQQHAKAALRIAQTALATARTFLRLDDEDDEVDDDDEVDEDDLGNLDAILQARLRQ